VWHGNPTGARRAERASGRFPTYVPDLLVAAEIALPASLAADDPCLLGRQPCDDDKTVRSHPDHTGPNGPSCTEGHKTITRLDD
jgi:hypothetical protein